MDREPRGVLRAPGRRPVGRGVLRAAGRRTGWKAGRVARRRTGRRQGVLRAAGRRTGWKAERVARRRTGRWRGLLRMTVVVPLEGVRSVQPVEPLASRSLPRDRSPPR